MTPRIKLSIIMYEIARANHILRDAPNAEVTIPLVALRDVYSLAAERLVLDAVPEVPVSQLRLFQ